MDARKESRFRAYGVLRVCLGVLFPCGEMLDSCCYVEKRLEENFFVCMKGYTLQKSKVLLFGEHLHSLKCFIEKYKLNIHTYMFNSRVLNLK